MAQQNPSVLVTGGGGFIGLYVVEQLLARGIAVRVFGRGKYPELELLGVETVRGDIADADAVARACVGMRDVHHVAACVELWHDAAEMTRTNVNGTANVIDGCIAAGVSNLIYASSASVVFDSEDLKGANETVPYPRHYTNIYAKTKAAAEQLVLRANGRNGLRTMVLRPHLVWGPRDPHLIPNLVSRARSGSLVQIGDGKNLVDVTYVENLAHAHILAAERLHQDPAIGGRMFFISQDEPVKVWEFVRLLLDRLGVQPITKTISYRRAYAIGALCEAIWALPFMPGTPPMTRFIASQLATSHYFDISAAKNVLGYRPLISMSEGIDRLAASIHKNEQ